nr:DUF6268 family outer membrane beta-barrel protein [uncultured Deefgea sp.]
MNKLILTAAALAVASLAQANDVTWNYSITPVYAPSTDLDGGGEVSTTWLSSSLGATKKIDQNQSLGFSISGSQQSWSFDKPKAWGGVTPWQDLRSAQLTLPYSYATADGVIFSFSPGVQYAAEDGADQGESINYGANAFVAKYFSPSLMLGLGVGAWQAFESNNVYPFLIVNWKITDTLSLNNPFVAGPVGPAGLELSWKATPQWELSAGGTWRSYESRLAANNPIATNGVLQNNSVPLFVRASYKMTDSARLDFYAGTAVNGEFTIQNQQGNDVVTEKYSSMPFLGLTLSGKF